MEDRLFVEVEGHARAYAIADEDLDREKSEIAASESAIRATSLTALRPMGMILAMACIHFTSQLRRFVEAPEVMSNALTLRAALANAFATNPRLQGYVLDDQGHLRANVLVFIDGRRVLVRVELNDPVSETSRVHVLQALSGG